MCGIFGVGTLFWLINPADDQNMTGKWAAPSGLLFFGGIVGLYFFLSSKTYKLADNQGIYGCTLPFFYEKIVSWDEIQRVEIKTKRNTLGEITSVTIVLRNHSNM
jgi:hypothetical protein